MGEAPLPERTGEVYLADLTHDIVAFNRGVVSPLSLARTDIKRIAMSAETQTNWMPRVLGSMSLRPGLQYIGTTKGNAQAQLIPFVFSVTQTAIIELTEGVMRILADEAWVTRPSVSTAITNGTFTTDLTGWTDNDESGGTSAFAAGGFMSLKGNGTNAAIRDQTVTVAAPDQNVEHALNVVIERGEVILRVGSTSGEDDLISETILRPGIYSLAFTPAGANVFVRLQSRTAYASLVDSCTIASAGVMEIATPWGVADFPNIRYQQSADVIFIACDGVQQKRIERRNTASTSWAVADYVADKGPFRPENTSQITITPSALLGDVTLTASKPLFKSTNVGGLYRIESSGQQVTATVTSEDNGTDSVTVTGVSTGRTFAFTISGLTATGSTVTLQRAIGESDTFTDVTAFTTDQSTSNTDGLENQIVKYRLHCKAGSYVAGTIVCTITYAAGSILGVARITQFTSSTVVSAIVLKNFGATTASRFWSEGEWSDRRGYPSAVAIHDGRLWWAGKDHMWGSVSDAFDDFDDEIEGDSGPIDRTIGFGPVDTINWLLSCQSLLVGGQAAEIIARASSLEEPLTPTNFNLKKSTTLGSLGVDAVELDQGGIFVNRSGSRIFQLAYQSSDAGYSSVDLTAIAPEIGLPSVTDLAIQRQIDTRIHAVRSDGKVAILVFDQQEDVKCWVLFETDGEVEQVVVLPGTEEDKVYYVVKRTVDGDTVRYFERWALESDCVGGALNKQADSFITYTGSATTTIPVAHLEGEDVVCWANGADIGTFTVASGNITLPTAKTNVVVGLPYTATFKSTKVIGQQGLGLGRHKRIGHMSLILNNTHFQGLRYGTDLDHLDELPLVEQGVETPADTIWETFDNEAIEVNGSFEADTRLYLVAEAPRPCTVLGAIADGEVHRK